MVLQQALADANTAYRNFFASLSGKRKGRKLGAPRFRSRKDRAQSIRFTKAARFKVTNAGRLRLPGIGDVPVRWSRHLPAEASSVTVTVDAAGRYHASFVVDVPDHRSRPPDREVGIDLGLTHFAVLSDGTKVDAPRIARKARGEAAAGAEGTRPPPERLGATGRSPAARSPAATPGWPTPAGTGCTSCPPRSSARTKRCTWKTWPCRAWPAPGWPGRVHDAGWSTFVGDARYKARRHGRTFARVDRWFPSTRACSVCGAIGEAKPLHVRDLDLPVRRRRTTGTSTPHATSWPRDARTAQRSWSWCQPGPRSRNRP